VLYPDQRISCNFADNTISVKTRTDSSLKVLPAELVALRTELETFLDVISGKKREYVDLKTAGRVLDVAIASKPKKPPNRPKIAVVGGGIFGTSCAAKLSELGDVTLFERHDAFLTEASNNNQWRHHTGFHYARSDETVFQIKRSTDAFEAVYGDAVDRSVDSYFCTAKSAEIITRERYLAACRSHDLEFKIKHPPREMLDRDAVSLSLLTNESIYDLEKLRKIATRRVTNKKHIRVRLSTLVSSGKLAEDGRKLLTYKDTRGRHTEAFDYVINTTYAGRNLFSKWFGFAKAPLRYDLFELPVVEVPAAIKLSVTVLDGPFCAMISNGVEGMFSLSHIHESLLSSTVTEDGLPPKTGRPKSNWHNIKKHCEQYFPILSKARYVGSRIGLRTIYAYQDDGRVVDYDGRPTVGSNHGFGCYSILAGKIITSVSNADDLFLEIEKEIRQTSEVS
jgi:glycine/D-amino acid oxidase-like deaminating enzyme